MIVNKDLEASYAKYNRKYFRNRLPKDMKIAFSKLKHELGTTMFYRDRPLYILIDSTFRTTYAVTHMTLLHEMVHVENNKLQRHGPKFEKRMRQLARQGAFRNLW